LKELKAAQYVADLAAHHRDEDMKRLKAFNRRKEQETAWKDAREWEEKQAEAEKKKANDQLHLFSEQRENKDAAKEELRQVKAYLSTKIRLDAEEKRADRAMNEARASVNTLKERSKRAQETAEELHALRSATPTSPANKPPALLEGPALLESAREDQKAMQASTDSMPEPIREESSPRVLSGLLQGRSSSAGFSLFSPWGKKQEASPAMVTV